MEVRKGFKQTDIGIMPDDWNVVDYISVGQIIDGDRGVNYPSADDFQTSGYCLFLNAGNVTKSGFRFDECQFISAEKDKKLSKGKLTRGDCVLTTRGTVGNFAYFNDSVPFDNLRINSGMVILRNTSSDIRNDYQYLVLQSRIAGSQLERLSFGSAQPQLTVKGISTIKIPLPPTLAEQEAIAEALSDADALIESLETLLAKKRQVKQGAMSELLSGKRRVVESGEWEVKRLGDIFDISAGGDFDPARSSDVQDERFPYPIYSNAITDNGLYGFCSYNDHQSGSITVTARGTLGVSNYRDHDFTAIGRVIVLKPTQPLDGRFISEYINNRIEFVVESTGVPQLTAPQISKYEILFPPFEEQTAIAEILSDMDAEIRAVEEKLSKARAVKAGMMSELLTGRVRLV